MRYVAIALLTLTSRILIHDHHWETVELCGSMLTLACAYAVLTGGRGICRLLYYGLGCDRAKICGFLKQNVRNNRIISYIFAFSFLVLAPS